MSARHLRPLAVLFEAFDSLLLLARGGKMAYFGETGKDSQTVLDYFARHGAPCPPDENPAEHIVEVIQGNTDKPIDWVQVWNESEEKQRALAQLQTLNARGKADADYVEDTYHSCTDIIGGSPLLLHLNVPSGRSEQGSLNPQRQFLCSCRWYLPHRHPYHSPPR